MVPSAFWQAGQDKTATCALPTSTIVKLGSCCAVICCSQYGHLNTWEEGIAGWEPTLYDPLSWSLWTSPTPAAPRPLGPQEPAQQWYVTVGPLVQALHSPYAGGLLPAILNRARTLEYSSSAPRSSSQEP